jgi:hypothetical protein
VLTTLAADVVHAPVISSPELAVLSARNALKLPQLVKVSA